MTETLLAYAPREVSPPGETLRDLMEERSLSQAELSRRLGRPSQAVNEIIAGKKEITEDTALELERVLQVPAQFWLAREARYREHLARLRAADVHKSSLPWLERFPLKALQEAGVLPAGRMSASFKGQLVEPLLRFFGVASPEGWEAQYDQLQAQFRRARPEKQTDVAAITAWLRMGERQAARLSTADYDASALEQALPAMRALSLRPAKEISAGLSALCTGVGVALIFVPALPRTHVTGVARWVAGKPLIQLSLLGKWNDGFWFSLFHEVAHVLKHPTRAIFLDDASSGDTVQSTEEQEANRFATDVLIPRAHQPELMTIALDDRSVAAFAQQLGVHPGIVVGQLQHRKRIGWDHALTRLKARYEIAKR
jgi:HTH-type transcriptional regulator / antitoxin HigA